MKINDILKEGDDANTDMYERVFNSKFFKLNIEPYFKKGEERGDVLYHGGASQNFEAIVPVRKRTHPKDSKMIEHSLVNYYSTKKYGESIRNLFFSVRDASIARGYGKLSMIIPVDDYQLYYSTITADMYANAWFFSDDSFRNDINEMYDELIEPSNEQREFFKSIQTILELHGNQLQTALMDKITRMILHGMYPNMFSNSEIQTKIKEISTLENLSRIAAPLHRSIKTNIITFLENIYGHTLYSANPKHDIGNAVHIFISFVVELFINFYRKWLINNAVAYVKHIESTELIKGIPVDHEVMISTEEAYVTDDDGLKHLYELYWERKGEN